MFYDTVTSCFRSRVCAPNDSTALTGQIRCLNSASIQSKPRREFAAHCSFVPSKYAKLAFANFINLSDLMNGREMTPQSGARSYAIEGPALPIFGRPPTRYRYR